jgi:hypothetical protein
MRRNRHVHASRRVPLGTRPYRRHYPTQSKTAELDIASVNRHGSFRAAALLVAATLPFGIAACGSSDDDAADKDRFCELAEERAAAQPDIDFEKATPDQIKKAFGEFIVENEDNVRESLEVAPADIADDFERSTQLTQEIADTGDLSKFEAPAYQKVGKYLTDDCGLEGP